MLAASVCVAASCSKEVQEVEAPTTGEQMTFTAVAAGQTKTVVENGYNVYWSPNDQINVFYGAKAAGVFTSVNTAPAAKADFTGTLSFVSGTLNTGNTSDKFWGVYPYDAGNTCDGSSVTLTIPAVQTAVEGSFDPTAFPALAMSDGLNLSFWNVCGGVKFTVSSTGIKSVTFAGGNNEYLAGKVKVRMDAEGHPIVQSVVSGVREITVNAPDGGAFKPGVEYYMVIRPIALSSGFTMKFTKAAKEGTYTHSTVVEVKRSIFGVLANKDADVTFTPRDGYITFVDESAKYACLDKFDSNHDGKISYAEADAVTTLEGLFSDYDGVEVFPELEYFTNVTNLKGAFQGCADLREITIPENITTIGINAFVGCAKLTEITIPETVTTIETGAFDSNLKLALMKATSAPSIVTDSFAASTDFCVPEGCANKYKLKSGWKDHKEHIFELMSGANCFIVNRYGSNAFDATKKGNSDELIGEIASAEVVWESFGTSTAPAVGDIVSNVRVKDGIVTFTSAGKDGNAVIAAKDAAGDIIWSWHIWVCQGFDADATAQVYNNNAGTVMDRNLGATSATKGDVKALGLLYQWGRKDPFLGSSSINSNTQASSTITWPASVSSDSTTGTSDYVVKHPTTFVRENSRNHDWYYPGSNPIQNTFWDLEKGMYDPCPKGWRVPDGGINGLWAKAFGTSGSWKTASNWDSINRGMDFGNTDKSLGTGTIWYPASGCLDEQGILSLVGSGGNYWSCTPKLYNRYILHFYSDSIVYPSEYGYRSWGMSVRCVKE